MSDHGPMVSIMLKHDRQLRAARSHATAEGHSVDTLCVLESYDRQLHPWIHGRRPTDLAVVMKNADLSGVWTTPTESAVVSLAFAALLLWLSADAGGSDLLLGASTVCLLVAAASLYQAADRARDLEA